MDDSILNRLAVKEIKTQSDFLAEKIKDMIASRELEEGFFFPNENDFCKTLNVSRSTLREAYKILETQGFIQRTKKGTSIKHREVIAQQGNFAASLELAASGEIIEFVCVLEPEAVALAAEKATDEQIDELEKILVDCEESETVRQIIDRNWQFHNYIRRMARNNLITSVLTAYYDIFNTQVIEKIYVISNDTGQFKEASLKQHREIFAAIKNRQPELAKELETKHLKDSMEFQVLQINK